MRITCFHAVVLRKTPSSKKTGKWDKLYLVERRSQTEVLAAGVKSDLLLDNFLLPDAVVEIESI